jgi:hypothetical protein
MFHIKGPARDRVIRWLARARAGIASPAVAARERATGFSARDHVN